MNDCTRFCADQTEHTEPAVDLPGEFPAGRHEPECAQRRGPPQRHVRERRRPECGHPLPEQRERKRRPRPGEAQFRVQTGQRTQVLADVVGDGLWELDRARFESDRPGVRRRCEDVVAPDTAAGEHL